MKSAYVKINDCYGCVFEMEVPEEAKKGDYVLCELEKGTCLGIIITEPEENVKEGLKKVAGIPKKEEVEEYFKLKEKEENAFKICKQKIEELNLPMKLLSAEYFWCLKTSFLLCLGKQGRLQGTCKGACQRI